MKLTNADIEQLIEKNGKVKITDIPREQIERGEGIINRLDLSQIDFSCGKPSAFVSIISPLELVQY